MPTLAHRKRRREIMEFFRDRYAAVVDEPTEAKDEITTRFGISKGNWYNLVPDFRKLMAEAQANKPQGALVEAPAGVKEEPESDNVLEIPADLAPDAKALVNALLSRNQALAAEVQIRDAEINSQRALLIVGNKRASLLKKCLYDVVEAL